MISIIGKNWIEKKVSKNSIEKINQDYNFNYILSKLIVSRHFDDTEIHNINNGIKIKNIFRNNDDFNKGADILIHLINNKEKICILGDYDVDGSCSTALLVRFFEYINQPYFFYIPDRFKDGYGASKKLFKKLIKKKPKLVIMVDCGSTSIEAVNFLNKNNIKSIIIDHHEINYPYPKSDIIINPKKINGYEKYNYLCATTLTYFFIDIVKEKVKCNFMLSKFLIYVLLASVCDVMPLRKVNRQIALYAINEFDIKKNIAFNTLFQISDKNHKITIDDLGYFIGPIINAGGRLGYSDFGTKLLSSDNPNIVKNNSIKLIKLNNKRKEIEKKIISEIDFKKIRDENKNVIIYYKKNINEGIIGIIAARLKEYFDKPSIVITNSNNLLKGSARSIKNYNIGNLIEILNNEGIIESGGGHNMAAGFILKKGNLKKLDNFIQKDYLNKNNNIIHYNEYDIEISSSAINNNFMNEIKRIGPFGNGNMLPIFLIKDLKIISTKILNNNHILSVLKPKIGRSIKSICFNCVDNTIGTYLNSYKKTINVVGHINENIWNNKRSLQLNIKDIIL